MVTTGGALVGDVVWLTKGVPFEGLSLLARERRDVLSTRFDKDLLDRCANFLYQPGISVVEDAAVAMSATSAGGLTSMHDPTEGGLATALWEVSDACGHGIQVEFDAPGPFLPEVVLCKPFDLDPWGLIASGALLFAAKPDRSDAVISAFANAGINLFRLGSVVETPGVRTQDGALLKRPDRDEIARIYE
jgi:hydrogenase maturation factor